MVELKDIEEFNEERDKPFNEEEAWEDEWAKGEEEETNVNEQEASA